MVKGRLKIFLVFSLMFFSLCIFSKTSSADQLIFDDFVFSGQSVVKNDIVFVFYTGDSDEFVTMSFNNNYANIKKKECISINFTKVCYNESTYDPARNALSARINIYTVSPKISIIKKIGKYQIFINEEAEVNVTIANTGDGTAFNAVYEEEIPDVQFTLNEDVGIEGQKIVWRGSINRNTNITFKYRFKPLKVFDRTITAKMTYNDGTKQEYVIASPTALKSKNFIDAELKFSVPETEIGKEVLFSLVLTNNYKEDVRIRNLRLRTAEGLSVTTAHMDFSKISESSYQLKDILLIRNETKPYTKIFNFTVKPVRPHNTELFVAFDIETKDGSKFSIDEIKKGITTEVEEPSIIFQIDDTIESFQEKKASIYLRNPSNSVNLVDVNVEIFTNLTIMNNAYFQTFNKSSTKFLFSDVITGPETDSKKEYPISIEMNYKTEYGDSFSKEFSKTVAVIPAEPIEIIYDISKTKLESGEIAKVRVSLKNKRKVDVKKVNVSDAIPEALRPIGVRSNFVNINKEALIDVYSYSIKAPWTADEAKFFINTTVWYRDESSRLFDSSEGVQITVIPKKPKLKIERKVDAKEIFRGQIIPVDYVIKNEGDERMNSILLTFPIHQNIDLIGKQQYLVEKINPGETINLKGIEKVRPKLSGGQRLDAVFVQMSDEEGHSYNSSAQALGISVRESYAPGAEIYVVKAVDSEISSGNFTVTINLKNIGESASGVV